MPTWVSALKSNKRHLKNEKKQTGYKYAKNHWSPAGLFTVESSEPVANASPDGWNLTLLTSDSLPSNIWTYWPLRMSQTNTTWSELYRQELNVNLLALNYNGAVMTEMLTPDRKMLPASEGEISMHITSAWCPTNVCISWPVSTSQSLQVLSPLPVNN